MVPSALTVSSAQTNFLSAPAMAKSRMGSPFYECNLPLGLSKVSVILPPPAFIAR